MKKCQQCQLEKPVSDFNREERNADQLSNKCKGCRKAGMKQVCCCALQKHCCAALTCRCTPCSCYTAVSDVVSRHWACPTVVACLLQHPQPTVTQKQCKKCNIIKHASEFCKSKWGVDGLHSRCNSSTVLLSMQPVDHIHARCYIPFKTQLPAQDAKSLCMLCRCKECIREALPMTEVPTVERKQCSKCHIEKPSNEFDRYKRTADGLQSQCKSCMKVSSNLMCHIWRSAAGAAPAAEHEPCCYWSLLYCPVQ